MPQIPAYSSNNNDDPRLVGLRIRYQIGSVHSNEKVFDDFHCNFGGQGHADYYGKPWEEVVYEGSPYFPQGKTYVDATFKDLLLCGL